jgi:hypothetical protein
MTDLNITQAETLLYDYYTVASACPYKVRDFFALNFGLNAFPSIEYEDMTYFLELIDNKSKTSPSFISLKRIISQFTKVKFVSDDWVGSRGDTTIQLKLV